MSEAGLTRNQIITLLTRSPHGKLDEYVPHVVQAAHEDPQFLAHLIAWNETKGSVRDAKVALPVSSLIAGYPYSENSLAHLALLDPRNLARAMDFAWATKTPGHGHALVRLVEEYLRARESSPRWWERTVLQHRQSMKRLYARFHVKPAAFADQLLFKGIRVPGGLFDGVAKLPQMPPPMAAEFVLDNQIPFLVAVSVLGKRIHEPAMVLALIERMSATELVTNTKLLHRLGVKDNPALRAAYEAGLSRVSISKKAVFKTSRAADAVDDAVLSEKLRGAQERQLDHLGGVEGDWLVLADKSSSMAPAIAVACQVAVTLARMARGKVHLIFFDTQPHYVDATGLELDALEERTENIRSGGSTSIGCGLLYALERELQADGIVIVSDGGENTAPIFSEYYPKYCGFVGKDLPVYLYLLAGNDRNTFSSRMESKGFPMQTFDLTSGVDLYSLPNVVATMRTQRYGLVDEILATPLLTTEAVFAKKSVKERAAA